MRSLKYQRHSRNWKIGRLTKPYHVPASERFEPSADGVAYHVAVPSARYRRQTTRTPTAYTKTIRTTSASTELRSRNADAMALRIGSRRFRESNAAPGIRSRRRACAGAPRARGDQERQCYEETHVNLEVQQKRDGRPSAQRLSFQSREHQERQPRNQRNDDDALPYEHQRVVGEVRPTQKLEERPTQDDGELLLSRERARGVARLRCPGFHMQSRRSAAPRTSSRELLEGGSTCSTACSGGDATMIVESMIRKNASVFERQSPCE